MKLVPEVPAKLPHKVRQVLGGFRRRFRECSSRFQAGSGDVPEKVLAKVQEQVLGEFERFAEGSECSEGRVRRGFGEREV